MVGRHPTRVLVVDDDADWLGLVCHAFAARGFEVEGTTQGEQALRRLSRGFDAVVIDLYMPAMDGWSLARAIRREAGPRLPLIILSAVGDLRRLSDGILAGANCYLSKGAVGPEALPAEVTRALEACA